MDNFEQILERLIDNVVRLQNSQSESLATRRVTALYPTVLKIRDDLQSLHKHEDQDHPLQALAREVRSALRNKEFNALLLAAFNWRSASKPRKKRKSPPELPTRVAVRDVAARTNFRRAPSKPHRKPKKKKSKLRQHVETPLTPAQRAQVQKYTQKFLQDLDAFLASPAAKAMRAQGAKDKEHIDIFKVGRRMPGSFGART